MNEIEKKIFIVGTGRCGTTWIGTWLRQHPEIFGGPETHIFHIMNQHVNPEWNQGLKTWVDHKITIKAIRNFIIETLSQCKFRKNDNQKHLLEHSHCHYQDIDLIKEIFPDALFIHVYRDVRNVIESKYRMGQDYQNAISNWIAVMQDMNIRKDNNILNVKYEDLVETPKNSNNITKFLQLNHHKDIDSWEFPVNTQYFSHDPDRWKNLSKPILESIANSEAPNIMEQLGYEFSINTK